MFARLALIAALAASIATPGVAAELRTGDRVVLSDGYCALVTKPRQHAACLQFRGIYIAPLGNPAPPAFSVVWSDAHVTEFLPMEALRVIGR